MEETAFYWLNGVVLVLVQLVVRVLNWPLVILFYSAQYHNWDLLASLHSLYTICIVSTATWQALEIYWFLIIIRLVAGFNKKKKSQ